MPINENMVQEIVQEVMSKMQIADAPTGKHGIFKEMNDAIEAAKKSQLIVKKMSIDQREKIITCIRKKIKENAEVMARMGVEETGMGNVGDKILKHHLVADKTPGTEVITTTAWSGDRGLTLIEMGPFGVIGAITPCTNPSETILCNTMGMLAGGNTVVFNPHPAAIKTSIYAINLLNEASLESGVYCLLRLRRKFIRIFPDCVIMNIQRKSHSTLLNREITKIWQRPDMLMISRSQTIMQSYPQARA